MNFSRKFTSREKLLLCVLALIVLAACYYFFVQLPVSDAVGSAREEIASLEDELVLLEAQTAVQDKMLASLEKVGDTPEVETPEYDNLQQLVAFLHSVLAAADEYELSFEGIDGGEENGIVRRTVNMTFTARSYTAARNIISSLNNCPYRCAITDVQLLPEKQNNEENSITDGKVSASLSITFFERKS